MVKRHESLYPLSHHHHHALVQALKLKRAGTPAGKLTNKQLQDDLKAFWYPGGVEHFREEEEVLLATYSEYGDIHKDIFCNMLIQHVQIHNMVNKLLISTNPQAEEFQELGHFLDSHIRLEEREIFPLIESTVPEEALWEINKHFHVNNKDN